MQVLMASTHHQLLRQDETSARSTAGGRKVASDKDSQRGQSTVSRRHRTLADSQLSLLSAADDPSHGAFMRSGQFVSSQVSSANNG